MANIYPTREPPPPFPFLEDVESNIHIAYCFFFFCVGLHFQAWSLNSKVKPLVYIYNTVKQEWYIVLLERYIKNVSFQKYDNP